MFFPASKTAPPPIQIPGYAPADGGLGAKIPAARRFFVIFLKKKAILMPLDHISRERRTI